MKKTSATLFTTFSKKELANLTKEVKETIATGFTAQHHKNFTVADLWNIHSNAKARVTRRYL